MISNFARRFGSLSSWQFWTIFWILLLRLILALGTDPTRTGNYSPLWFVIWLISSLVMVAYVGLVMVLGLYKRLKRKPAPWLNLMTVGAAGVLGNATTGGLANYWGLDTEQIWTVRITAAVIIHVGFFILVNSVRASTIERNERIRELLLVEQRLQGYRESAKEIANDELEKLRKQSIDALVPHIDSIEVLIAARFDRDLRDELLSELSSMITDEVRPLSRAIAEDADKLATFQVDDVDQRNRHPRWQSRFIVRRSIHPLIQGGIMVPVFAMIEFLFVAHNSAFRGALGGLGVVVVFGIIKALLPRTREINTKLGLAVLVLLSIIATGPSWYFMWFEYGWDARILPAGLLQIGVNVAVLFVVAFTSANDLASQRFLRNLEIANELLSKEIALFEQKLALNRKNWGKRIHGDVQGALAAALTRLKRTEKPELYEFELIKSDLARARAALSSLETVDISFGETMDGLVSAWAAVCKIEVRVSARAQRALDASVDARGAVNEICKEAVSNAVRHGDAKRVQIELDRQQDDIIELRVSNDGLPRPNQIRQGLGTGMIEDLSLSWDLSSAGGKTTLSVLIPVQLS